MSCLRHSGPGESHAGSELDPEGLQRTRDPDPGEAREEIENVEDES